MRAEVWTQSRGLDERRGGEAWAQNGNTDARGACKVQALPAFYMREPEGGPVLVRTINYLCQSLQKPCSEMTRCLGRFATYAAVTTVRCWTSSGIGAEEALCTVRREAPSPSRVGIPGNCM